MADANLAIGVDTRQVRQGNKDLTEFSGAAGKAEQATKKLALSGTTLDRSLSKSAGGMKMGSNNANNLAKAIEVLGNRANTASVGVGLLSGGLAGFSGITAASKLIEVADAFQMMSSRVAILSANSSDGAANFRQLYAISNELAQPIEASVGAFTRLETAITQVGGSTQDTMSVVATFGKAMTVSGVGGREAASALTQFSQAMASGKLNGDEFRSMAENSPYLLNKLSEALGISRGELRKMSTQGKLTSDVLLKGFQSIGEDVGKEFEKVPLTVGRSINLMSNAISKYVGEANTASGTTGMLAQAIKASAENFDTLVSSLQMVAVAYAAAKIGASSFGQAISQKAVTGIQTGIQDFQAKPYLQDRVGMLKEEVTQLQANRKEIVALSEAHNGNVAASRQVALQNLQTAQSSMVQAEANVRTTQASVVNAKATAELALAEAAQARERLAGAAILADKAVLTQAVAAAEQKATVSVAALAVAERELLATEAALNAQRQQHLAASANLNNVNREAAKTTEALQIAEAAATNQINEKNAVISRSEGTLKSMSASTRAWGVITSTAAATAGAAMRGLGAVFTALGGWVGLAITGVALLAMNWDGLTNAASKAAKAMEDAASRGDNALRAMKSNNALLSAEGGKAAVASVNDMKKAVSGLEINIKEQEDARAKLEQKLGKKQALAATGYKNQGDVKSLTKEISQLTDEIISAKLKRDEYEKGITKLQEEITVADLGKTDKRATSVTSKPDLSISKVQDVSQSISDAFNKTKIQRKQAETAAEKAFNDEVKDGTQVEANRAEYLEQYTATWIKSDNAKGASKGAKAAETQQRQAEKQVDKYREAMQELDTAIANLSLTEEQRAIAVAQQSALEKSGITDIERRAAAGDKLKASEQAILAKMPEFKAALLGKAEAFYYAEKASAAVTSKLSEVKGAMESLREEAISADFEAYTEGLSEVGKAFYKLQSEKGKLPIIEARADAGPRTLDQTNLDKQEADLQRLKIAQGEVTYTRALDTTAIKKQSEEQERMTKITDDLTSIFSNSMSSLGDNMTKIFDGGKFKFGDMIESMIGDLTKLTMKALVLQPIMDSLMGRENTSRGDFSKVLGSLGKGILGEFGGSSGYGMLGTQVAAPSFSQLAGSGMFSASGGFDIPAGVNPVTQLHEREMVLPAQYADTIRSMSGKGGTGDGGVHVTVVNQSSQPVDTQASAPRMEGDRMVVSVILKDLKNNGPIRQNLMAMQGR